MMEGIESLVRARSAALALAMIAALSAPTRAQPESGNPLGLLTLEKGKLGWDGVELGMSLVQAERRVGSTLSVDRYDQSCPAYVTQAERNGLQLTLGFASPKPGAKIEWLRVRFEGIQVLASGAELMAALRELLPEAKWRQEPGVSEEDDLRPTFEIAGKKETLIVRLLPREAMILTTPDCLD